MFPHNRWRPQLENPYREKLISLVGSVNESFLSMNAFSLLVNESFSGPKHSDEALRNMTDVNAKSRIKEKRKEKMNPYDCCFQFKIRGIRGATR